MNTSYIQRRQTIFRFEEDFLNKLKFYAGQEDKSLNAYVESILRSEIERRESLPKLAVSNKFSDRISKFYGVLAGKISQEDIANDDRLRYLLTR